MPTARETVDHVHTQPCRRSGRALHLLRGPPPYPFRVTITPDFRWQDAWWRLSIRSQTACPTK